MATYPSGIKAFSDRTDQTDLVLATDINQAYDEITAIQTELGLLPKGGYADVTARLAGLSTAPCIFVAASNASAAAKAWAAATGGYVCDGTADEVEIQDAIDALPAVGGTVMLSEGTFYIAAMISITIDNCLLVGQGTGDHQALSYTGNTVFKISGALADTPDADHTGGVAIKVQQTSGYGYVEIRGIKFSHTSPAASDIWVKSSKNVFLTDLMMLYPMFGFEFYDCSSCTARNVWIREFGTGAAHKGVYLRDTGDSLLDNVHVEGTLASVEGYGIFLYGSAGNQLRHCWAATCNRGIGLLGSYHCSLDDCWADYNRQAGLWIEDYGVGSDHVRVSGGSFYNNGVNDGVAAALRSGIYIVNSDEVLVTGSYLGDSGVATQQYGVYETGTSDNNMIANCNTLGNGTAGIVKAGASTIIRNNQGHATEASGTSTLVNGQTSIAVTHGLAVTPTIGDVMVTPVESWGNATKFWISAYSSTTFTITVDQDPGADVDFAWRAVVL